MAATIPATGVASSRSSSGSRRLVSRSLPAAGSWALAAVGVGFVVIGLFNFLGWTEANALGLVVLGTMRGYLALSGQRLGSVKALGVEAVFEKAVESGADPQTLVEAINGDATIPDDVKDGVAMVWRERRERAVRHQRAVQKALDAVAAARGWTSEAVRGARRTHDFRLEDVGGRAVLVDAKWTAEAPDEHRMKRWLDDVGSPTDAVVVVTSSGAQLTADPKAVIPLSHAAELESFLAAHLT